MEHGRTITEKGKGIDEHQVHAERLAYVSTEVEAARALLAYHSGRERTWGNGKCGEVALGFAAEVGQKFMSHADIQPI